MITLKQNYFHKCLIQSSPFRWFLYQLFFFSLPRYWIGFLFHKHFSSINCRNFYEVEKVPVNERVKKTIELVRIKRVKSLLLYHLLLVDMDHELTRCDCLFDDQVENDMGIVVVMHCQINEKYGAHDAYFFPLLLFEMKDIFLLVFFLLQYHFVVLF